MRQITFTLVAIVCVAYVDDVAQDCILRRVYCTYYVVTYAPVGTVRTEYVYTASNTSLPLIMIISDMTNL